MWTGPTLVITIASNVWSGTNARIAEPTEEEKAEAKRLARIEKRRAFSEFVLRLSGSVARTPRNIGRKRPLTKLERWRAVALGKDP